MRGLLLSVLVACALFLGSCAPVWANAPQPLPVEKAEPAKPAEPRREGSSAVSYTLAAIGTILVMVLVCMPARRE